MTERWLPVPGYEGLYEVSDQGRVWSNARPGAQGKLLVLTTNTGYPRVTLSRNNVRIGRHVHNLVMEAFIGPRPEGLVTRHLDGNPLNNRLGNLAYGTTSENQLDAVLHGTHPKASVTHCPQNHPYDETNTVRDSKGRRLCLTCRRARDRQRPQRRPLNRRSRAKAAS